MAGWEGLTEPAGGGARGPSTPAAIAAGARLGHGSPRRVGVAVSVAAGGVAALVAAELYVSAHSSLEGAGLVLSYLSGMTMLVLPCTLPMVFVIVPLAMARSPRRALAITLAFGFGISLTLAAYGATVGMAGHFAGIARATQIMWLIGGVATYAFGLSQLGLIRARLPAYSGGMPRLFARRGPELQALGLGLLLGNAGIGCPCPAWYLLLTGVATSGSPAFGAYIGLAQGLGRITPIVAVAVAASLGLDSTRALVRRRIAVERASGGVLVVLGAVIVAFMALGHPWWEATALHLGWNRLLSLVGGSAISEVDPGGGPLPAGLWWVPALFVVLTVVPFVALWLRRRRLRSRREPAARMPVIRFFTMPGCGACVVVRSMLDRVLPNYPGLEVEEIDLAERPEEASRYGVMACPALALDSDLAFVGGVSERALRSRLDRAPATAAKAL